MQQQYRSKQLLCGIPYSNLQHNYHYSMVKLGMKQTQKNIIALHNCPPLNLSQLISITHVVLIAVKDDDVQDSVKSLNEKLSAALLTINAKEDLVKQHTRVAEEAVAGNFFLFPVELK